MSKLYIIEDNEALVKVLTKRVKSKSELTFITLKDFHRIKHEVTVKKQKIVVDISRNRDYISYCDDLKNVLRDSLDRLLLLVNSEQFSDLKNNADFAGSILSPQTVRDVTSFIDRK